MHRLLRFGVSTHGGPLADAELRAVSEAVLRRPDMVLWYEDFASPPPVEGIRAARRWGASPVITWEPWYWVDAGKNRTPSLLDDIRGGRCDDHLARWADALRMCGTSVYLRFAHEFNGSWYPWSPAAGTSADDYAATWRHVHAAFARAGADNVRWIWSAASGDGACDSLADWYPGGEHVDVIAVDGYNWGTSQPWTRWTTATELFGECLPRLRAIAPGVPLLIAEVACAEDGGSKPEWIRDLVRELDACPDVVGFVWFDHNKETDWRLTSSSAAAHAMADALSELTSR